MKIAYDYLLRYYIKNIIYYFSQTNCIITCVYYRIVVYRIVIYIYNYKVCTNLPFLYTEHLNLFFDGFEHDTLLLTVPVKYIIFGCDDANINATNPPMNMPRTDDIIPEMAEIQFFVILKNVSIPITAINNIIIGIFVSPVIIIGTNAYIKENTKTNVLIDGVL